MIVDRAEMILTRIKEVLQSINHPAAANVYRGRGGLPADKRPAMCLLRGGETPKLLGPKGLEADSTSIMVLRPQILVQTKVRAVDEAEQTDIELSALRMLLLPAIRTDEDLRALCSVGANGAIIYKGHATDMEIGSPMEGQMLLYFDFEYVLDPEHMTTT